MNKCLNNLYRVNHHYCVPVILCSVQREHDAPTCSHAINAKGIIHLSVETKTQQKACINDIAQVLLSYHCNVEFIYVMYAQYQML